MKQTVRTARTVSSLVSALSTEATAGTGVVLLQAAAAMLVLLSPGLVVFTFGGEEVAKEEVVLGSLISLVAFTSTTVAIVLVRLLVEEGTLELLLAIGVSKMTVGVGIGCSLLIVALWQCLVLVVVAIAALAGETPIRVLAGLCAVLGLCVSRVMFGSWAYAAGNVSTAKTTGCKVKWLGALIWLLVASLLLFEWRDNGVAALAASMCTAAWGSLVGAGLGLLLRVPQALVMGLMMWLGWTAVAPMVEDVVGFNISPLATWNALLSGERCGSGGLGAVLLSFCSLSAWCASGLAICSLVARDGEDWR